MKIAISTQGEDLDAQVDPRFGRCRQFIVVDPDSMQHRVLENSNAAASGGAGIQTAQFLAAHEIQTLITGNCGPNAFKTLNAAGIKVYIGASGTVRQALEQYDAGQLELADKANVTGHFGDSR